MMKATSFCVGTPAPTQLCSNAGLMLLTSTADAVGVADAIDAELDDWQNPNLLHTTGNTMTALALALALGGDDANDVDLLNPLAAIGLVDQVPSDSTVHRRHKELADHDEGDGAGTTAVLAGMRTAARTVAWAACGTRNPAVTATTDNPLVIDLDATEILAHSDKEKAALTWKKHFGFHLLAAILDHGDGREWGKRLLIRTDAAGESQAFLGHLDELGLRYSVGLPVTWQIGEIASTLGKAVKQGVIRPDGTVSNTDEAYVADITSRMHSWAGEPFGINLDKYPDDTRIIRVEHPARGAQLRMTDIDGRRVQAFVTSRAAQLAGTNFLLSEAPQ